MARNVNEIEADESEQDGHIMEQDTFLDVLQSVNALKSKGKKVLGDISAKLTKAEADHNLDKRAFAVISGCMRMEPTRLHAFLRHFDAYREYAGLDDAAGADMFEGKPKGKTAAANGANRNGGAKKPKAPKPAKPASKKKKAPEVDATNLAAAMGDAILSHETETAGQG